LRIPADGRNEAAKSHSSTGHFVKRRGIAVWRSTQQRRHDVDVDRSSQLDDLAEDPLDDVSGGSFASEPLGVDRTQLREVGEEQLDLS
jgi:hypothetical protein